MSTYSPRSKRPAGYNVQRATAPTKEVAPVAAAPVDVVAIPEDKLRRRNAKAVNHLLSSTVDWLASLPPTARPLALATKYPRLANRIAQEWREPSACRRDFDDLVYDNRGDRRGFPADVHRELLTLRDYYCGFGVELAKQA